MKTLLALIASLLLAGPAFAQAHGTIPNCTAAEITGGNCVPEVGGAMAYATDTTVTYFYTGGAWNVLDTITSAEITDGVVTDADLDSLMCSQVIVAHFDPDEGQITYIDLTDSSQGAVLAAQDNFMISYQLYISQLSCDVDVPPGAGKDDWKIIARRGAEGTVPQTSLAISIDEGLDYASDSTTSILTVAGSRIMLEVDPTGPLNQPDAAADMVCAICLSN